MLRAGFIGAGPRSQGAHYPNVSRVQNVEIVAVCEMDEQRLGQVAGKYGIQRTFTDHRKMLDTMDLDVIYCVMNEKWLLQPALDCLNAGKHIFIEKPPGANSDETRQLLDAAVANDVYAMVGLQRRFTAVNREAKRRVDATGQVTLAKGMFNKRILGGNGKEFTTTLWNDVIHIVDMVRYLAGGEATEVTAYRDKFGSESRNCYTALIRFDNKATGIIEGNRASGGRVLRGELHGVGVGCYMKIPEEIEILEDNKRTLLGGWDIEGVDKEDVPAYEGVLTMHQHFVGSIEKREVPLTDLRDVIHTVELVDQIEGSMED
ncbi:MAG: Gfo/Idh/MocA family oxidoreductase [Planctomycetota bacterium]|nr:Gfo/Idh/MocA family oxidoreductase [Planctomycetota bacterium]MDA1139455.1 Gfo/Idh/MocA family oxidoreductase [Planctomycetota bacterium]